MIISIESSPRKNKRYRVHLKNGQKIDFGLKGGSTYIDHGDKVKRKNYWARHLGNPIEKRLIEGLIPSPALFSAYLLWGESKSLKENIKKLNRLF